MTLRTFTLRYGSAYRPLVGGLANVFESTDRGGVPVASKDVWVLKESASRARPAARRRAADDQRPLGQRAGARACSRTCSGSAATPSAPRTMLRLVLAAHAYAEDFQERPRSTGGTTLDVLMGTIHGLAGPGPEPHPDPFGADFRSLLLDPDRVGLGGALARGAARRDAGRARPAVGRHVARLRHRRPGRPGAARAAAQPPGRRVGRPDAHRDPGPAGRDGEHDARPGLAHDRRGPLPRAVAPGVPPARRDHHRPPRASTSTARCSTRCSPRPRARSPTGAATAATSVRPASSSCCCSTRTTRGRWSFCLGELRAAPGRAAGVHRLDPAGAAARGPGRRARARPTSPPSSRSAASAGPTWRPTSTATGGQP